MLLLCETFISSQSSYHPTPRGGREVDSPYTAGWTSFPLRGVVSVALPAITWKPGAKKPRKLTGAGTAVYGAITLTPDRIDGVYLLGKLSLTRAGFCNYNNSMEISFDTAKRDRTLIDRGLDFADAGLVFQGLTVEVEDTRQDYGEQRIICYGLLAGRLVVVGYTPRGAVRHIFSMRKANEREKRRIGSLLGL